MYPATKKDYVMSLKQFEFSANGHGDITKFPLERTLIQIDEAHLLVTPDGKVNYTALSENLFRHRANRSPSLWPKLVLHTATTVAASPCDPIRLLNLLVDRSEAWLDFTMNEEKTEPLSDFEMNKKFLDMYVMEDGRLNAEGNYKWDALAAGRISYISMYGDRSHFAQLDLVVSDVTLSETQSKNMLCSLKYDASVGKLKCPGVTRKDEVEPDDSTYTQRQNNATKQLLSPNRPQVTKKKGAATSTTIEHTTKHAPSVKQLIDGLVQGVAEDKQKFAALRAAVPANRRNLIPKASKIFLYVCSDNTAATKGLFAFLDHHGFQCLNPIVDKKMQLRTDIIPYRAYIDHTRGMTETFTTTDPQWALKGKHRWDGAMQKHFNASNNDDGARALIFVGSNLHREGISLMNVRKVYVAGAESTTSNLIQAIARAVRYCSSTRLEWIPGHGWTIQVFLQRYLWNSAVVADPNATQVLEDTFAKMLRTMNPHGSKFIRAMDCMTQLISASGVDNGLFGQLNSSGMSKLYEDIE